MQSLKKFNETTILVCINVKRSDLGNRIIAPWWQIKNQCNQRKQFQINKQVFHFKHYVLYD